jgi:uncharacterized protein with NAD-binding domain and iron-sulfur cluster
MTTTVAVIGGGVAGLSAAHHLIHKGFAVELYERTGAAGGKSKSTMGQPSPSAKALPNLPGEHGFRFFPGFYRHLPATMAEIPEPSGGFVDGNLVQCPRIRLITSGGADITAPTHATTSAVDFVDMLRMVFAVPALGLGPAEVALFANKLLDIAIMPDADRFTVLEPQDWWTYVDAANQSANYQRYLAAGLTHSLVAADAHLMSARTGGVIALQILKANGSTLGMDRILNGPTEVAWTYPWMTHLTNQGVKFHFSSEATAVTLGPNNLVAGVTVTGQAAPVQADYYVFAIPAERMGPLVSAQMTAVDPILAGIQALTTSWMNGIQYYLYADVPINAGHTVYLDSPWALTSVSQQQFWQKYKLDVIGPGSVHGCLSVDISDWNAAGVHTTTKAARDCTADEIAQEVWGQLKHHLNQGTTVVLDDSNLAGYNLDNSLTPASSTAPATNSQPLLVNVKSSWALRPRAVTGIGNMFLAADYVRTWTDLATMEGADEAARRAVNGILAAAGSTQAPCDLWPLTDPDWTAPIRDAGNAVMPLADDLKP